MAIHPAPEKSPSGAPAPELGPGPVATPRCVPVEDTYTSWQRQGPPSPPAAGLPDGGRLLRALRRRWLVALMCGLLAAGAAAAALQALMPVRYIATASLQIAASKPTLLRDPRDSRNDFLTFMKTQAARIKNRDVLLKALSVEEVRQLPLISTMSDTSAVLRWLEEELKVEHLDGGEFLMLSLSGEDGDSLVTLVNAIARAYLHIVTTREGSERKERVHKMEMLAQAAREKLAEKIALRQGIYKDLGVSDPGVAAQKQHNLTVQLHDAQKQLLQAEYLLEKARSKLQAHQAIRRTVDPRDVTETMLRQRLEADPVLKETIVLMQATHKLILRMEAEGHPPQEASLVIAKRKYEALRQEVETTCANLRQEVLEAAWKRAEEEYQFTAHSLRSEIIPLENQARKWQERLESLTRELAAHNQATARADLLNVEIEQDERQLAAMQDKLKDFRVEEESEQRVSLAQEATCQPTDGRRRWFILGGGPLAAFAGVVLAIGWMEGRRRRIYGAEEITQELGLRLLGQAPGRKQSWWKGVLPSKQGRIRQMQEALDGIRPLLLRIAQRERWKVFLVCSPSRKEGRTTIAVQLALSCARAGKRTLLVDGDLGNPACHRHLEQTLTPGLSEALKQTVTTARVIRATTAHDKLSFLPAGRGDARGVEALAGDELPRALAMWRSRFDVVIIDTPATAEAAHALQIGQHADAAIMVARQDWSSVVAVGNLRQRLSALGIQIAGGVMVEAG